MTVCSKNERAKTDVSKIHSFRLRPNLSMLARLKGRGLPLWFAGVVICGLIFPLGATAGKPSADDITVTNVAQAIGRIMSNQESANLPVEILPDAVSVAKGLVAEEGFYLSSVAARKQKNVAGAFQATGLIVHRDTLSRSILTRFAARCSKHDSTVSIESVTITPFASPHPRIAFFLVPASRISLEDLAALPFGTALQKAYGNARRVTGRHHPDKTPQDYIAAAFLMEKRSANENLTMVLADKPASLAGSSTDVRISKANGWYAVYAPVRLAFDNGPERFFNFFLGQDGSDPHLLTVYSNYSVIKKVQLALTTKGYDSGRPDGMFGTKTRNAILRFQKDHGLPPTGKASLSVLRLLRLSDFTNAVGLAQASLKKIGYDPGPTDGKMGSKTRVAIRKFQKNWNLKTDGVLTEHLLCLMLDLTAPEHQRKTGVPMLTRADRYESKMWPNKITLP